MKEEISQINRFTQTVYILFWLVAVCLVVAGEFLDNWVGLYADNVRATYMAETLVILLTAVTVPVSLKLFSWMLERKINAAGLTRALHLYALWSCIRMCLLALPVITGLAVYYGMLSNKGLLCALIGLTASLFCIPGRKRLHRELRLEDAGE